MATTLGVLARRVLVQNALGHVLRRGAALGRCPICAARTVFYAEGEWLRDQLRCLRCYSIPRWRALVHVLETELPRWREMRIHESSPGGAASDKIAREAGAGRYTATFFWPDVPPGETRDGYRCENLAAQTFGDGAFDLVVTQDVMEHVLEPAKAFAEIARTLRPGGAHVFTVPWERERPTRVRAVRDAGGIRMLEPAHYHQDPIDPSGALVVTDWGADMAPFIAESSGMTTTVFDRGDRRHGIDGKYREVFVSRKNGV